MHNWCKDEVFIAGRLIQNEFLQGHLHCKIGQMFHNKGKQNIIADEDIK